MELTQQQYEYLKDLLQHQRGNLKIDNRRGLFPRLLLLESLRGSRRRFPILKQLGQILRQGEIAQRHP